MLSSCHRAMIFGGTATVEQYRGNPRVQAHGPGFSKILLGDDVVDQWEEYLDVMVESIYINSGRGCINCSGIWASRHTQEIAQALAERLGPIEALPPEDPQAGLAAFTVPGSGQGGLGDDRRRPEGKRRHARHGGIRSASGRPRAMCLPASDDCPLLIARSAIAKKEYMFPFSTVVECPQERDAGQDRPDARLHGHHATTARSSAS